MRTGFVHLADVELAPGGDVGAPGAAITAELCGEWDHPPPCPLAPHHTAVLHVGDALQLRIVFAAEPDAETEVRRRIASALSAGELTTPEHATSRWTLRDERPGELTGDEAAHARRLADL